MEKPKHISNRNYIKVYRFTGFHFQCIVISFQCSIVKQKCTNLCISFVWSGLLLLGFSEWIHYWQIFLFDTRNVPHMKQIVSHNQLHCTTRSTSEWEELHNLYDDEWSSNQPSSGRKLSSITECRKNNYWKVREIIYKLKKYIFNLRSIVRKWSATKEVNIKGTLGQKVIV